MSNPPARFLYLIHRLLERRPQKALKKKKKQTLKTPLLSYKAIYAHNISQMLCAFSRKFLGLTKIEYYCLDEHDTIGVKPDISIPWEKKNKVKTCKFSFIRNSKTLKSRAKPGAKL